MIDLCEKLKEYKTVAVVGISRNRHRPSRDIAEYLLSKGYKVVGVNPAIDKVGEIDVYPSLRDIPFEVDIVNVFRRSEAIPEIMDDVIAIKPKMLWLQLGIRNNEALAQAEKAGIETVQDQCILVEHSRCY